LRPVQRLLARIALEKAISFEERSYRFYESALRRSTIRASFDLLKRLLSEELKHRMRLEEVQKGRLDMSNKDSSDRPSVDPDMPGIEGEYGGAGIRFDEETDGLCTEPQDISDDATPGEILLFALRKEQCSYMIYNRLKDRFALKGLRAVYADLAQEEYRHIQWIEEELKKYPSYADEKDH
jgi:rubrerythrin